MIGLSQSQKQSEIIRYAQRNNVEHIIVFSDEHFFIDLPEFPDIRQIGYKETIMYRTFYPLLEEIDDSYLLVMNEMMRDKDRSCLTYNCMAKYTNQTPHRIVFEYLPIIDSESDLMILLDFDNSQKYKGIGIRDVDISSEDIRCIRRQFEIDEIRVDLPDGAVASYNKELDKLFDAVNGKEPDTVPRNIHIWTGRHKIKAVKDDWRCVARNARFKRDNIVTFQNIEEGMYILIDIPHSQKDFNDFLRVSHQETLPYISSGLPIDRYYIGRFNAWIEEVNAVYAKTSVYEETS